MSTQTRMGVSKQYNDFNKILPDLYQGARPPVGRGLLRLGFRCLVLAAEEYQPSKKFFPRVAVRYAPMDDHSNQLTEKEWNMIFSAATDCANAVVNRQKTLITCWAGINRSGIITAVTVMLLTDCSGAEAVRLVKGRRMSMELGRPGLSNDSFAKQVELLG